MRVLKEMDEKKVKSLKVWENFVPVYLKKCNKVKSTFWGQIQQVSTIFFSIKCLKNTLILCSLFFFLINQIISNIT